MKKQVFRDIYNEELAKDAIINDRHTGHKMDYMSIVDRQTPIEYYDMRSKIDIRGEVWCDIGGFVGLYQVSNFGRIKALAAIKKHGTYLSKMPEKILRPSIDSRGYFRHTIQKNNLPKYFSLYRMVAECFIPNPKNKPTVNHLYGNKSDNRAIMLEWATNKEQINHADDNGLRNIRGQKSPNSKLTDKIVVEIRRIKKDTRLTNKEISVLFGVYQSTIQKITSRKTWKHL